MVRLTPSQGTIYNEPKVGVSPQLDKVRKTRQKTIEDEQKDPNTTRIQPRDAKQQFRIRRNSSLLKMREICDNPSQILFQTKTVFPFDFFPDELKISSTKIEIKQFHFINTYTKTMIPLQDIAYVEINTIPFFATMKIGNIRVRNPVVLRYLPAGAALKAKRIIDGLLIAQESGVDISVIEPKALLPQIESLAA
jgi:hypothetical protein